MLFSFRWNFDDPHWRLSYAEKQNNWLYTLRRTTCDPTCLRGQVNVRKIKQHTLPFLFPAMYCDQYHFKVICEKGGQLIPANLTQYGLIKVSLSSSITRTFFLKTYFFVNSRMFSHRGVAIRVSLVSCLCYFWIPYGFLKMTIIFSGTFYQIGGNICQSPVSFMFNGWRGEWYNITFIPT